MSVPVKLGALPAVVLAHALLACGGDSMPPDPDAGRADVPGVDSFAPGARVELGTGEDAFEPIMDGETLQFIRGPQGGWHFLGSVRVSGLEPGDPDRLDDPDNPTTEFRVTRDGARVDLMAAVYTQGLRPVSGMGGTFEMVGRLVILDIMRDEDLDGVTVDMEVTVNAVDGSAGDRRTIRAERHPLNP